MWNRRRRYRRFDPMRGLKGLALLLAVMVGAYLLVLGTTTFERLRRSAEAVVEIDARRPYTRVNRFGASYLEGWDLAYTFEVDGREYRGTARRPWLNLDAFEPKVCFVPGNPSDHWLVAGSHQCGSVLSSGVD